jgi:hypothetical protein
MVKTAAVLLVVVLAVATAVSFLWIQESACQRELIDRTPELARLINKATLQSSDEVERLFLQEVAGNASYQAYSKGKPPGGLIGNAGSGRGTARPGYLGGNSEIWFIRWSTPYPNCDYSKLPITGGFTRVHVDVRWYRDWHVIPRRPKVELIDYDYPQNAFLLSLLRKELDAMGLPYTVQVILHGR